MDSCRINVDGMGAITATMHTTSSGQGHETLVGTVVGEVLQVDPDSVRVTRPDSLNSLPSGTPVGSRMAIMLGGAAFHAAQKLKAKLTAIAAHDLGIPLERAVYEHGNVYRPQRAAEQAHAGPISCRSRTAIFTACRQASSRGSRSSTSIRCRPAARCRQPTAACRCIPASRSNSICCCSSIDPDLGTPEIVRYRLGHDCGTQINPKIVRGMTMGGIAHGIGAALYEEFAYNDEGQLIAQSFMDYLLPSSHEVPAVEIVDHETPSPHTVLGQKGSGESGYLGAPAAIANAINDAIRPLGISINTLPIKVSKLGDLIAAAREKGK